MTDGKSNTGKIVGITCGVLVLLSCCGGGIGFYACKEMLTGHTEVAETFLGEIRTNNYAAALTRMSSSYQQSHDVATFQANVAQVPGLTTQTAVSFTNMKISNNLGTASGTLTTPQGDLPITITATKVGENWFLDSVQVNGVFLQ